MNPKKIMSLLLVLLGEVILILCFVHFGKDVPKNILTLNIFVSSIFYCLIFIDIIIPWVDFSDKSQRTIGSIGIRWFFTFMYLLIAIGAMIVFNTVKPIPFSSQLLVHSILFFLLLVGLFTVFSSMEKVNDVFHTEKQRIEGIEKMRSAVKVLQMKLETMDNIPAEITIQINEIHDNIRYLSPCNNPNARELENQFVDNIKSLSDCFFDIPLSIEKINSRIKICNITYKERKQIFSK